MTVKLSRKKVFFAGKEEMAQAVRTVLRRNSCYKEFVEQKAGSIFITSVKPSWYLLGTQMTITLQDAGEQTGVQVETMSQPFIFGDALNYYGRYIDDFFNDLAVGDYTAIRKEG